MEIIAKQIPPEWQSYIFEYAGTYWENLAIVGNRHYNAHMPDDFRRVWERFDENRVLRALKLYTGRTWDRVTIRGYCQGDWQDVYYPVDEYSREALQELEIEYFNLGTEWEISRADAREDSYCMYCYSDTPDQIRAEIAAAEGVAPDKVTLLRFNGWTRSASYKEV